MLGRAERGELRAHELDLPRRGRGRRVEHRVQRQAVDECVQALALALRVGGAEGGGDLAAEAAQLVVCAVAQWREFAKAALAWAIASGLILAAIAIVGDPDRTAELEGWLARLTMILGIWSLWPITYTLWPAKPREAAPGRG